jgi:hypothetical protein
MGAGMLLGLEASGKLVACETHPVPKNRIEIACPDCSEQLFPAGRWVAVTPQELIPVSRAEAAANGPGGSGQPEVIVEEDLAKAGVLDLPQCLAVLRGGWRVQRGACIGVSVRAHGYLPAGRRRQWDSS